MMKNRIISGALKIFFFIALIVIFDQTIGSVLRILYFNQKEGQDHSLIHSLSDSKEDVLIIGASQAQNNYDPRLISSALNMSCYNAGLDGGHSIIMQYAQIKIITARYTPKVIILEFNPENIVHYIGDYDRLSILLPYYKDYPEIRPFIHLKGPYEEVKLLSAIYPFNSNIISMIVYNTNSYAGRRRDIKGYVCKKEVLNKSIIGTQIEKKTEGVVDPNMVSALRNIIQLCKEKNIFLYIVSSPLFHEINEKQGPPSSAASLSLEIIRTNKVHFLDFSYDTTFLGHMELFYDLKHLNEKGATIFSKKLSTLLIKNENQFTTR